jgi:hypothetical protein
MRLVALLALLLLAGCTGCNRDMTICGPYSSFFWLPD